MYLQMRKIICFLNSTYLNHIFSVHIGYNKILYYLYNQILKVGWSTI